MSNYLQSPMLRAASHPSHISVISYYNADIQPWQWDSGDSLAY